MREYKFVSGLIVILLFFSTVLFARGGDIQITCEPGLRIYLDEVFVGKSKKKEDGMYLSDIKPGRHTVRIEKTDFEPKEFICHIQEGKVIEIKVGKLEPAMKVIRRGESVTGNLRLQVGNLKVFSAPMRCEIQFRGKTYKKEEGEIEFKNVPTGKHLIRFTRTGSTLAYTVEIKNNRTIEILAHFKDGKVYERKNSSTAKEGTKRKRKLKRKRELVSMKRKSPSRDISMISKKGGVAIGITADNESDSTSNFPYPYYIAAIRSKIASSWYNALINPGLKRKLTTTVYFKILRSGKITDLKILKKSGVEAMDLSALRAIENAAPFSPLPRDFPHSYLGIQFEFEWDKRDKK